MIGSVAASRLGHGPSDPLQGAPLPRHRLSPPRADLDDPLVVSRYLFYRLELYGGADAKAIVALSLAYPVNLHGRAVHPIAPIGVLLNALILSLTIPVALFMFNAYRVLVRREDILSDLAGAPFHIRLAALFLGTPSMRFEGLRNRGRS